MEKTCILIANGERARFFERHDRDHSLTELADFVHPVDRLDSRSDGIDRSGNAGKGHGRSGHAGTQFEPHTDARAKERGNFARQLAQYLNEAVAQQKYTKLVLICSSPMLGELRPLLNSAADKALQTSVASDLTSYQGADLKKRINHALQLSD